MTLQDFKNYAKKNNIALIHEMQGYKTGDIVNVINGVGRLIKGLQIKGFAANLDKDRPEAVVYVYDDCYWFPVELSRISKA